jgi:uncharacterized protein (DUF305 family)
MCAPARAAKQLNEEIMNGRHIMQTAAASSEPSHHHGDAAKAQQPSMPLEAPEFVRQMDAAMKKMMDDMHAPGYTGNPDVDFLAMMIPHHQGAVDMARLALIYGKDPLTRRLAEEIIASQTVEISGMSERLTILRRGDDPNPAGFPALHGTRGATPR